MGCSVKCNSSLVTSESIRSGMRSFNRNTTWTTSSPLTNPDAQYSKILSRGFRENLVGEKRCSNGHPTPSEATYITAERQKRQQLRHCSRFGSNIWLFLLRCAVCCINRHGQSTCSSHKKDSWQTYESVFTALSEGPKSSDAHSDDRFWVRAPDYFQRP